VAHQNPIVGENRSSVVHRKSIQINTNLEPSQSKKQYELALAQAKYFKENNIRIDKKTNQSSISCGNITVNLQAKDQQDIYETHNKHHAHEVAPETKLNKIKDKNSENNSKNHGDQSSQSAISPGSFYTPNSFYQQPSLTSNIKQSHKNMVGGTYSCKSG
jgi:hypothetical protein